jgi:hypothetical protein
VPAKVIVLRSRDAAAEESLISDISKYANTQNSVKLSDLSANKPFHVEMEKLASSTYCPNGVGRWFYERASGSYNTMLAREGTTPARLKHLKEVVIPPSRRVTKTDLAKYLNAWNQKPDLVSCGSQRNFEKFMETFREGEAGSPIPLPDVMTYKRMIAQVIIYQTVQSMVRRMFRAFQGNVATYLVSVLSDRLGHRVDLEKIWAKQDISEPLKEQLRIWASEVNDVLHRSSGGRMISEWAKRPECWEAVRSATYSEVIKGIPEVLPTQKT